MTHVPTFLHSTMKKLFGLIGYPLSHSFSKKYFTKKFEQLGLGNHSYELFPLKDINDLPGLLEKNPNLGGLNVTIPYKEKVIPFLHETAPEIQQIQAVNTIKVTDGQLTGFNTDVYGFEESLKTFIPETSPDLKALVLGSGGAAKAVSYVLQKLNIPFLIVSRRSRPEKITYSEITPPLLEAYFLIINTTPLGMSPNVFDAPQLPYNAISEQHFLFDLIYNPEETFFLKRGRNQGALTKNGLEMLYLQAEKAWNIWNH